MIHYLSIGGNAPGSCSLLRRVIDMLEKEFMVVGVSDIYTTAALNGLAPGYYNAVVAIDSPVPCDILNARFKEMERELGRRPEDKAQGIVPVDIDIVVSDGHVLRPRDYAARHFRIGYDDIAGNMSIE